MKETLNNVLLELKDLKGISRTLGGRILLDDARYQEMVNKILLFSNELIKYEYKSIMYFINLLQRFAKTKKEEITLIQVHSLERLVYYHLETIKVS
ncbi:MAG: hypothetical protein N2749_00200 [Clostridia bacterium]|nr:hypothetical protein [Clostridia bacterium]